MKRHRWERDMNAEMQFHLQNLIRDYVAGGLTPAQAEQRARQEFGPLELAKDECRDTRPLEWARSFAKDVQHACRNMRRTPGFSLTVIATLALGIGASATVLSVARAFLLRSLPYPEPDRLVAIYERRPREANMERNVVSYPDFADWRAQNDVFEAMGAFVSLDFIYSGGDQAQRVSGAFVTHEVLPVLGAHARLGRDFNQQDDAPNRSTTAIITDAFWRRSLQADPNAVGQSLLLSGRAYTIVGVLPADFVPPVRSWEVFVSMEMDPIFRTLRDAHGLSVIARRRPAVSLDRARQSMDVISRRLEREYSVNQGHYANVLPLADALRDQFRPAALALLGAAALLLLIACFNAANLMLARASARSREVATRLALGAARARVVRQFLTESLPSAVLGALLGIALSLGGILLIRRSLPPNPSIVPGDVRVDGMVLAVAIALAFLTALVCGALPAYHAASTKLGGIIQAGERQPTASPTHSLGRFTLVVSETALALVLLVGAGLLLRSFWKLESVHPGFRPEKLLTLQLVLPPSYVGDERIISFQRRMLAEVHSLPGVLSAGFTSSLPLTGQNMRRALEIEGVAYRGREPRRGNVRVISPGYVEAMRIPVLRGRSCQDRDADKARAAIINQTAARLYWTGRDPLGTKARLAGMGDWTTVVGIVGDVKHFGLEDGPRPEVYLCSYQLPPMMNLVVRTQSAPETSMSAVRLKLREIDRGIPPFQLRSMEDIIAEAGSPRRFLTVLVAGFAALALLLAAGGIFAQLAYSVTQRRPEIGIRMACGASPGQVMCLVVRQAIAIAGMGLGIGFVLALGFAQLIQRLLFGVPPVDRTTLGAAALLLLAVAALACLQPAWRAARSDPAQTLRNE